MKIRPNPASLSFKGQATIRTTAKSSITPLTEEIITLTNFYFDNYILIVCSNIPGFPPNPVLALKDRVYYLYTLGKQI